MSTHGTRSSREVFAGSAMAFRALGYRLWPGKLAWIGFEIGFLGPPIIDFAQKIGFVLQFSVSDRAPNRPCVRLPSHSGHNTLIAYSRPVSNAQRHARVCPGGTSR